MAILGKPAAGTFNFNSAAFGANSTPAPDSFFAIDEGTGTTLTNIGKDVGSYNGTIDGAVWGTDSSSPILTFDGSNDFASFGSFGISAYPFTLALIVRGLRDATAAEGFFYIGNDAATSNYHGIRCSSAEDVQGQSQNGAAAGVVSIGASDTDDGSYHLAVLVCASSTSRVMYWDNSLSASDTAEVLIGTINAARLGSLPDSTPSNFANIAVAAAMVWKGTALSAAQVQTDLWNGGIPFAFLVPNVTGTAAATLTAETASAAGTQTFTGTAAAALLAQTAGATGATSIYAQMLRLFRAQEGLGNNLNDSSFNEVDATADATLTWVSDVDLGTVPDLGGTVQVDCGDVAGADGVILTVAGWAKFAGAASALETVVSKWNGTGNQKSWRIWRSATGQLQFVGSIDGLTNGATKSVASFWPDDVPHHFVVEFNAGAVSVWKDLVAQTVTGAATAVALFNSTASLYIGGYGAGGGTDPADSRFKDLAIWNRAITEDERQQAYDGRFPISGIVAAALNAPTGAGIATETFAATAAAAISAVQAAGQGSLLFTGTSAANLAAMAATAAGDQAFQASAAALLGTISGEAEGDVGEAPVTGIAAAVLAVVTSEAFASLAFSGTADASLSGLTAAALAEQVFTGTATAEASGMLGAAAGELSFAAAVSALLQPIQGAAQGVMSLSGAAAALLAATTAQATGTSSGFSGEATATLAALVAEALAEQVLAAQGAGDLQALEAAASGGLGFTAAASALLAALTAQGTAALEFTGTASATLQALTGFGAQILVPFVIPGRVFTALAANRTAYALPYNRTFRAPETNRTFTVN